MWVLLACAETDGAPKPDPEDAGTEETGTEDTGTPTDTGEACTGPYAVVFDEIWDTMQETYPYFVLKGVDWHALHDTCRPEACDDDLSSRRFFNNTLDCLLAPLADYHTYVIDPDGEAHGYGLEGYTPNYDFDVADAYLDGGGTTWGDAAYVTSGTLTGTTLLYVRVESWAGVDDVDFDDVLATFPDATGFVVDVRANSGGDEGVAQRLGGALVGNAGVPYAWAQYRDEQDGDPLTYELTEPAAISISASDAAHAVAPRPVAPLVGNKCMSSCEGFVDMMVASDLTRTFGVTTRGSTGNPDTVALSDGSVLSSSRWYLTRADGVTPVEWRGIDPDEAVTYTGAGGVDAVIDAAIAWSQTR